MRGHLRKHVGRIVSFTVALSAILWISILAAQPVHVPIQDFSKGYIPSYTQVLSGVKGQTLTVPSDLLSRIDVWIRTRVNPGETTQVTFALTRGPYNKAEYASSIVSFDRSSREWQTRLVFDPNLFSQGDTIYLRMASILASPYASLHYAYVVGDLYPQGELLDLDRVEAPDQDLRFKLYRQPLLPKPLAWIEALLAPAMEATEIANGPPAWIVGSLTALVGGLIAAFVVIGSVLGARVFPVTFRREATGALLLVITAVVLAVVAGAEAPIGKLWVYLG